MVRGCGWKLFGAMIALGVAVPSMAEVTKCISFFEPAEGLFAGDEVIWRQPRFSGSTDGIVIGETSLEVPYDVARIVEPGNVGDEYCPSAGNCLGDSTYEIGFAWSDPTDTTTSGVRCTTFGAANLSRPSVHLGGKIRFKMAATVFSFEGDSFPDFPIGFQDQSGSPSFLLALAITESGNDVPLGSSDSGGDIEFVYLPSPDVIPAADANGMIEFPPGGTRFHATTDEWPPEENDFVTVEFDLSAVDANSLRGFANNGDGVNTAGDGQLDATTAPGGDGVNRGYLESIIFTNDPANAALGSPGEYWFIYIDDVEFLSPEPDSTAPRPTVVPPLFPGLNDVDVSIFEDTCSGDFADTVKLLVDGSTVGVVNAPTGTPVTFNGVNLVAGNQVTAVQIVNSAKSPQSSPVTVFEAGVLFADDFDAYADRGEFSLVWGDSVSNPSPADARINLEQGGAASCEQYVAEENPSGADGARAYRYLGDVNGTDAEPLRVTYDYRHTGGTTGARFRFELARQASSSFSSSFGARLEGTTGFIMENGPASVPLPQTLDEYNILLVGAANSNGFFDGNQTVSTNGEVANTGVDRVAGVWHRMQIEVMSNTINYYIDGNLTNPVDTNGVALYPGGVPRPNADPYNYLIIGQGFSNNASSGHHIDNVQVTLGAVALPFGPANPVDAPTISGDYLPGASVITIVDVDSNATDVTLLVNGSVIASTNGVGVFSDNTAVITVAPLGGDDVIQATQTVGGTESCLSVPSIVSTPVPTLESPLVPGLTSVTVSDIEEGVASSITIYEDLGGGSQVIIGTLASPATDPAVVNVSTLGFGQDIVATQTIGGTESENSNIVTVSIPAPTIVEPLLAGDTIVQLNDIQPSADLVKVTVNGTTTGFVDVSASSSTTVNVPVIPALEGEDVVEAVQFIGTDRGTISNSVLVSIPMCLIVFEDDFETNSASDWNVVVGDSAGADDAGATFAWDYSANAGIPPSPRGSGTTLGVKMEANNFDATAGSAGVTLSPAGFSFTANTGYRMVFDMWMNANGPFPAGGTGSTEFSTMGVGYDNASVNLGAGTAADGSGAWFTISGESGSSRDVRAYKEQAEQFPESGQYAAGTTGNVSNNTNADSFYIDLFGVPSPPSAQTLLYPNQTGNLLGGSAGFGWHRWEVTAFGSKARWSINDTNIVTIDSNIGAPVNLDGNVSVGYQDPFSSVSDQPAMSFGVADNVRVLVPHTPGSGGDYDNDGNVDEVDHAYLIECLGGPGVVPEPTTGPTCSAVCRQVFDFDADLDVDLADYAVFTTMVSP
jgi:hypothetical protein